MPDVKQRFLRLYRGGHGNETDLLTGIGRTYVYYCNGYDL